MSRDYHGRFMVFTGEILAHKCPRIESSETSNSFFYAIQKTKYDSSTDKEHDSSLSYLLNMGGTQNKPLIEISKEISSYCIERKIHLTAEYTFDSSLSNQTAD